MVKYKQAEMFPNLPPSHDKAVGPKRERTTHGKKLHVRWVEIELKSTGKRMRGTYGHVHNSPEFKFVSGSSVFTLTKTKWRVVSVLREDGWQDIQQ